MLTRSRYWAFFGISAYVIAWLLVLPAVADISTRLAIVSLALLTAAYCHLMARRKHRNTVFWSVFGLLAGLLELGVVPVVIISVLTPAAVDNHQQTGDAKVRTSRI